MNTIHLIKTLAFAVIILLTACDSGSSVLNADNSNKTDVSNNTTGGSEKGKTPDDKPKGNDGDDKATLKIDDISTPNALDSLRISNGRLEIMPESTSTENSRNIWLTPKSNTIITALSADVQHGFNYVDGYGVEGAKIALLLELTTTTGSHYFAVGANSTFCPVGYCDSHGYAKAATNVVSNGSQSVAYYLGRIEQTTTGYAFEHKEQIPPTCYYQTETISVRFTNTEESQREANIQRLKQRLNQLVAPSQPITFTPVDHFISQPDTTHIRLSQPVKPEIISALESESFVAEIGKSKYDNCSFHEGWYIPDRTREKRAPYTGENLNAVTIVTSSIDYNLTVGYTFFIALDRANKRVLVGKNNLQGYFDISDVDVFGNLEPSGKPTARFFIKHYSTGKNSNPSYIDNVRINKNNAVFDDFSAPVLDSSKWTTGKFSYSEK